jgi:hypothetical protein
MSGPYDDLLAKLSGSSNAPPSTSSSYTASSGLSPNQPSWMVYMGGAHGAPAPRYTGKALDGARVPGGSAGNIMTTDNAMGQFYAWSPAKRKQWGETLQAAGLIAAGDFSWDTLEGWWQKAVGAAGNIYTLGHQSITPEQWVKTRAMGNDAGGANNGFGATKASTHTSTTTTIPFQDPAALHAMIKNGVKSMLGRTPDDAELSDMMHVARQYEAANPSTQQSTVHIDTHGNRTQTNRTVSAGVSAAGYQSTVEDATKAKPEYASYQAATTYMNALMSAIQAPVQINAPG